ncbi:centrosomal protein CEP57L1 isoform X1 [Rhinatrema bivittatum]|uniref:centrosomal protein CEP57L1 isoform X1 n=1 Tax=Rhinatrema bivittatum TaxID=194408 RepID=UPI001128B20C|nr:centrosomal protein CEP57L1 isoform X1 [Rhinatrema bivittatum]XP_029451158.1 centrosomal protein CEP57L1 isoform X1 [Rhinatrema bivittatum]
MDSELNSYVGSFHLPPNRISLDNFATYKQCSQKPELSGLTRQTDATTDLPSAPNSQALMLALKMLQEKIRRLERERLQAEDNVTCLSRDAAECKNVLESEKNQDVINQEVTRHKYDITTQLAATKARCILLEKQLDYMRNMVQNAEMEKKIVLEQQTLLQKEKELDQVEIQAKLDKLDLLEKECHRLSATQVLTENKISQLTEKLTEEEQLRKLIENKAAKLQTGLEVNRIMMSLASAQNGRKRTGKRPPGKKMSSMKKAPPLQQVYMKSGLLPFVAGKSASSSHSVSANVQSVLHMMKHHSPRADRGHPGVAERKLHRPMTSYTAVPSTGDSLTDILLTLQDELGQMSFEHQELLKQIQETKDDNMCEDLERELDHLVKQMETKSDQILKLKKHQDHVQKLKQKAQKIKKQAVSSKTKETAESKVVPAMPAGGVRKSTVAQKSKTSLQLLRHVQSLQTTLKRDDIMWEK